MVATLLATLSTPAPKVFAEGTPDSTPDVPHAAASNPERTRADPGTWTYTLRYQPTPSSNPSKGLESLALHVPHGYAPVEEMFGRAEGTSLMLLALYPSLAPRTSPDNRCGKGWCGDEVSASIHLALAAPQRTQTGSVQSEVEANFLAKNDAASVQGVPAPPGYEEAFTAVRAATPSQPRLHTEFLVHRDERGEQQIGQCNLASANPTCLFSSFDTETHLLMLYDFSMTLLEQRQSIEGGLRALVGGWQARNR